MHFNTAKWDNIITVLFVIMSEVLPALQHQFVKIFKTKLVLKHYHWPCCYNKELHKNLHLVISGSKQNKEHTTNFQEGNREQNGKCNYTPVWIACPHLEYPVQLQFFHLKKDRQELEKGRVGQQGDQRIRMTSIKEDGWTGWGRSVPAGEDMSGDYKNKSGMEKMDRDRMFTVFFKCI